MTVAFPIFDGLLLSTSKRPVWAAPAFPRRLARQWSAQTVGWKLETTSEMDNV